MKYLQTDIRLVEKIERGGDYPYYRVSCYFKKELVFDYLINKEINYYFDSLLSDLRRKKVIIERRSTGTVILFNFFDGFSNRVLGRQITKGIDPKFYWMFLDTKELV